MSASGLAAQPTVGGVQPAFQAVVLTLRGAGVYITSVDPQRGRAEEALALGVLNRRDMLELYKRVDLSLLHQLAQAGCLPDMEPVGPSALIVVSRKVRADAAVQAAHHRRYKPGVQVGLPRRTRDARSVRL